MKASQQSIGLSKPRLKTNQAELANYTWWPAMEEEGQLDLYQLDLCLLKKVDPLF